MSDPNEAVLFRSQVSKVAQETNYVTLDYGRCPSCQAPVVIPGLSHSLCADCGWVKRNDAAKADGVAEDAPGMEATGHFD
jgi:hypothetical protein